MNINAPEIYTSAIQDLEKIIAQETSGIVGAIPEQEDRDLAQLFVKMINSEARQVTESRDFEQKINDAMDRIVNETYSANPF